MVSDMNGVARKALETLRSFHRTRWKQDSAAGFSHVNVRIHAVKGRCGVIATRRARQAPVSVQAG